MMVGYTKKVEHDLRTAPASATSVRLLKERADIPTLSGIDLDGRPIQHRGAARQGRHRELLGDLVPAVPRGDSGPREAPGALQDHLQIIGIAQDSGSIEDVKRFAAEHGMNYPTILSTPDIEKLFPPVSALPTSFFLDRDGRLAQKHVGMLNASLTSSRRRRSPARIPI
jgi:hypothetical protein